VTDADPCALLELEPVGEDRYAVPAPAELPHGDVVYGGQLMAQMIVAASAREPGKYVKSLGTLFCRTGSYGSPNRIELQVEPVHNGRTWASQTITAWQGDRLLVRANALLTADEPDFIAHQISPPAGVGKPGDGDEKSRLMYPGSEFRTAPLPEDTIGGAAAACFWTRMPGPVGSLARSQAILAWDTNGQPIELSARPHADVVRPEDMHKTVSTGVIGHTMNFHREFDAGTWLLVSEEATFAGKGRIHGRGAVFTEDGTLVATFSQDSMVKAGGRGAGSPL
jgi:acyl-CoA thioesterase-2